MRLPKGMSQGQAVGIGVTAAAMIGLAIYVGADDSSSTDGSAYVKVACRDWVKDRLKSPGSADFSSEVATHEGARYTVRGAVDSDNSFGASIRNTYVCVATYTNEATTLVGLTGLDQ